MPPAVDAGVHGLRQLGQDVRLGGVLDGVDGVEAQPVEAVLLEPVEGIVDEEVAHRPAVLAVEVDGGAPGRVPVGVEEALGEGVEVVPLGAEVVIDHVEEDHHLQLVGRVDQRLQLLRPPVDRIRREDGDAVVAPVPRPGKVGDRHQLDGGDAQILEVAEPVGDALVRAFRREGADVQLVEDRVLPRPPGPVRMLPGVGVRVDHLARAMDVVRLEARHRIRRLQVAVDLEAVAGAGADALDGGFAPSGGIGLQRQHPLVAAAAEAERHRFGVRRPQAEAHAGVADFRPEGHAMAEPCHIRPFRLCWSGTEA